MVATWGDGATTAGRVWQDGATGSDGASYQFTPASYLERELETAPWMKRGVSPSSSYTQACEEADAEDGAVSLGTTIMAVEFSGGVVLGSDTRTSAGQLVVHRGARKITQLHQRLFVCRSGSAADTQTLAALAKRYINQHVREEGDNVLPTVGDAASLLQLFCYHNKNMLSAGLIVAGWDSHGGGQVYQIPLGGTRVRQPYAIGGSGSGYVAAYAAEHFRSNMTRDECVAFVRNTVNNAIHFDGSSGGLVRTIVVTGDGVEEEAEIARPPA